LALAIKGEAQPTPRVIAGANSRGRSETRSEAGTLAALLFYLPLQPLKAAFCCSDTLLKKERMFPHVPFFGNFEIDAQSGTARCPL
jgi:hypothetical protein